MSSHSLRQYAVATPNYLVAGTSHDAHSGRAKALHGRRWAAIPVISAESHYALLPAGRIPAAILAHRPLAEYLFKRHCLATLHPNPRLTNSLPIRGPKSALEPYHTLLSSLVAGKLQGVRVSPLSAGGGGLCRAQPEFPSRPGKQAEGIHKQLGFSPVSYFFVNPPNSPRRPDGSVPWGHKFRLWKFRYKVVKRRKKMSVRLKTRDQATHQKKGTQAKARQIAARKIAPRRPDARSGMRTIQGAPRSLRLLIFLLSCPPANCVRIEPGQPGNMHPLHIRVGKRAWLRAQKQANQQGYAWYRGRILCSNGAPCQTTGTMPPNLARRSKPVVNSRGATARLKVMTLNVGHMSAFLWGELKAHLGSGTCDYDVVCLQELHWTQTCQFSVGGWSAVVSAGQDKSDGVMVLVNPRFKQSQVKYDEILKGRLLRVQLAIEDSRVEVFCCYQYVWQTALTKDDNLRRRQNLLDKLCTHVRAIAKRSTVIVLGDFNAELVPSQGRVGQSLARTPRHVGPEAPSPYALTRAVEEMELVALNTWCTRFPHTSFTSTGNSQIDFIWVREASADKTARLCQPADPAIGSWRFMGHKQLDASIRLIKHFHLKKAGTTATRVDKVTLSEHARIKHPSTDTLRERVRVALAQVPDTKPDAALANINKALLEASAAVYPSRPRARNNNQQDFLPIWQLRDVLRKHWRRDILGLFQAWKFSHKLARMAKDARSRHIAQRRERVSRILLATQEAADTHLPHKVYQLVSQLKPWSPRPRPRLKSKQGELLTAKGEHQRLVAYCKEVFAPALSVPEAGPPKLLMTAEDWTKYLGQTQIGKAVPQGSAPAAAWKICSDLLGPHLERISLAVEEDGTLPSTWCSPELIWLTKPNKAPDLPEHLRPIGLLTPTAKAAAAAVRETLMPGIQKMLQTVPQFAYLANRDIYDALARVNGQIASIKHSLAFTVSNRFVQRQRREENAGTGRWIKPISGGALLSVDLHKAFDLLTREQLQCTLSKIDADEGIKHTALLLHTQCQYLLFHDGQANAVDTKRGVRQGCRLAPALWSAVSGDLLTNMVPDPFKGPMTVFADDHLGAWTFHTQADILAMERDVLTMFRVLTDAGMCVNPSKSKLIITVKGAEAERHTKRRIVHIQGQPHWCFEEGDARIEVPVVAEFVYLGTIVTLGRQSDRTVSHRLEEARKREGQLRRCIRNRSVLRAGTRVAIWRACVVASAMYGLLAQELTATNVATLRQWYHKSLRAVTNTPAHITHVSNAELRAKFGLLDPLESLLQLTRNKLRRLSKLQAGHAAKLASTMEHWNKCEQNLAILAHTDNLTLTPITADVSGVPCPYCGLYFRHTKAMRQHTARKHGVKWHEPLKIDYNPSFHAKEGMPECRHCGKRCGSHQGLKFHIMHNACGWHSTVTGGVDPRPAAEASSTATSSMQVVAGLWPPTPHRQTAVDSNGETPEDRTRNGEEHATVDPAPVCPGSAHEGCLLMEDTSVPTTSSEPGRRPARGDGQQATGVQTKQHPHHQRPAGDRAANHEVEDEVTTQVEPHPAPGGPSLQPSAVWATICSDANPESSQIDHLISQWKDRLAQHCCMRNNWALDKSSVKCHLIRMHAREWYRVAEAAAAACKAHKHLFVRDAECNLCLKKVYGVERHALQCPVLFQACFMNCLAEAPSEVPNLWLRLRDITAETCKSYLQGTFQANQEEAEALSRFCVLCARKNRETPIMDVQAWRRHLQQVHGVSKEVLTTKFHEHAAPVSISRPCTFCRMPFQKSPSLHRSKCLPLAQLLSIQHGYDGVGRGTNSGSVGTVHSDGVDGIHTRNANRSKSSQDDRGEGKACQIPEAGKRGGQGTGRGSQTPRASRRGRGRGPDTSIEIGTQHHPNIAGQTRPSSQSASGGQDIRTLLHDNGHVNRGHAEDGDQPLEGPIHERHMQLHTQGGPAHESVVGAGGAAEQIRERPGSHQGDGGPGTLHGGTEPMGIHGVEPTREEVNAHGSTTLVIRRVESGHPDAQGSSHDRGGHSQVCADAEIGGKYYGPGGCLHVSDVDADQGGAGAYRNGKAHQLCGNITHRSSPTARKASTEPSGEDVDWSQDVSSSRFPHCQGDMEPLPCKGGSEPRGSTVRSRSPHGRPGKSGQRYFIGVASIQGETPGDPSAENGVGDQHRGKPTARGAEPAATKKDEFKHQLTQVAPTPKRPVAMTAQATIPWQAPQRTAVTDSVPPVYCLRNRSNYCYLNSVAVSLHWAMLRAGRQARDYGSLGPAMEVLNRLKTVELVTHATWRALLRGWRRPTQQHDVTELMSFVVDPYSRMVAGEWQARCVEQGRDVACDRGSTAPFLSLDIQGKATLTEALASWHTQHYIHALTRPPTLLVIQLGRFRHNGRRTTKIRTPCDIQPVLDLPFFCDDQLACSMTTYRLCGGIVHIGDLATSGHYRPFCVHQTVHSRGSEVSSPNHDDEVLGPYILYDDDKPLVNRNSSTDNILRHNTYVAFYLFVSTTDRSPDEPGPSRRSSVSP